MPMMLSLQRAPSASDHKRFESDRESLPFPRGGVYGHECDHADSTQNGEALRSEFGVQILQTIDQMQSSLDTLERELGAELERELKALGDVAGRIGADPADDWPPTAA